MAVKQPTLPSFAQTFSSAGPSMASGGDDSNALPPIQESSRKRTREADPGSSKIAVKQEDEEEDYDMLDPSPTSENPPKPVAAKKRRLTVSGASHPQPSTSQGPPLPAVSKTIQLEQRRGSVPSIVALAPTPTSPAPPRQPGSVRTSPNLSVASLRGRGPRGSSPTGRVVPSQQNGSHTLPPPPISFAHRRGKQLGGKKKPADIVISPRDAVSHEQFQPSIQSAPPIPHSRGMMSLPRIPPLGAGPPDHRHRQPGLVPPTPTRFTQAASSSQPATQHIATSLAAARSPPNASVPISAMRIPPTPHSLQNPGYASEKSAFLAPFEMFYDALNDSKQLKSWLSDQLQKSQALEKSLAKTQENIGELVETLVERKVGNMQREIVGLRRRVDELEGALQLANDRRRQSFDTTNYGSVSRGKQPAHTGPYPGPSESYSFPPIDRFRQEPPARPSPPNWPSHESRPDPDRKSPSPYEPRRLSISAARLEGPGSHSGPPSRGEGSSLGPPPLARNRHSGEVPTLRKQHSDSVLGEGRQGGSEPPPPQETTKESPRGEEK